MKSDLYEKIRTRLNGGHHPNPFARLLRDQNGIPGTIQGTPEEFSQILYELTQGDLAGRGGKVSYEMVPAGRKDLLKFRDGSLFRVVKAKGLIGPLIVVAPYMPSMDDLLQSQSASLARLVSDNLAIKEVFARVANDYKREEARFAAEKIAADARLAREGKLENIVASIERAESGDTVMVRGMQNMDALVFSGFTPGLVDNPDEWIDAEEFPGMRYRDAGSGIELLLTGRERFRPVEEPDRLEFTFRVNRSDDDPETFEKMLGKYRTAKRDGTPYALKEFHDDLLTLVKYPEELKGRTEADLGLMAEEVEYVIDRRHELDKGILPYEAVFHKDSRAIIDHIRRNRMPLGEIRKALDYFEYTGMIDAEYKAALSEQIADAAAARPPSAPGLGDLMYDKRVKEIVTEVLRKIPKGHLTAATITIAMRPYVGELGLGKLVKIRERILQLKEMVSGREERGAAFPAGSTN